MRIPRVYLPRPLTPGTRLLLDEGASNHLLRVLRLQAGAPLVIFNGEGGEFEATLAGAENRTAVVMLGDGTEDRRESALAVTLAQGISRGERMDYTLQKAVELGVARIVPLETEFSQVRLDGDRLERRLRHWQGIIESAAEQCGRTRLPELTPPLPLVEWISSTPPQDSDLRLVLDPGGNTVLSRLSAPPLRRVTLLVGPEGGLSENEITRAQGAGYLGLRLGPRILRTETAGAAALVALQTLWGDLA